MPVSESFTLFRPFFCLNIFMSPLLFNSRHFRTLFGFFGLASSSMLSAQSDLSSGPNLAMTLPALVDEITTNNPERQFYLEEIAAAKVGQRYSATWSDPELSFDVGRKRVKNIGGSLAAEGTAWSVAVTQTFEWPGRLALRKSIANRNLELAELGLSRFEIALKSRAQTLAYSLIASQANADAVREVAERFTELKDTFLARDPAGVTPLLETRVIEAAELSLRRRATEAELAVQAALIELNQLRGTSPDAPLSVNLGEVVFGTAPDKLSLVVAAHENNFEYRQRLVELEQQGFVVRLAENDRYPSIAVSPFYAQESAGGRESIFGLGVSLPLPVTSRTRSAVHLAEARQRQAQAAVEVARRELDRQVITAEQAFATKVAEAKRWTPDAADKFREAAELADRHYRLGAVPIATYVELQNSYLEAVQSLLDTRGEALAAGLQLEELTGLDLNTVEVQP